MWYMCNLTVFLVALSVSISCCSGGQEDRWDRRELESPQQGFVVTAVCMMITTHSLQLRLIE